MNPFGAHLSHVAKEQPDDVEHYGDPGEHEQDDETVPETHQDGTEESVIGFEIRGGPKCTVEFI